MPTMKELKNFITAFVRSSANGIIELQDLEEFIQQESVSLHQAIKSVGGHIGVLDLIRKWPSDFIVHGTGLRTTIHAKKTGHSSDMNQRSKNAAYKQQQPQHDGKTDAPEPVREAANLNNSVNAIKSVGLHDHQAKAADCSWLPITTTDKIVLPSKPLDKKIGQKFIIRILDAINPHCFWFAENTEFRQLDGLMKKMTNFYKAHHTDLKINSMHIQKGLHVAIDYFGLWHRSVILKVKTDEVRVFYLDFGTVEDVPVEQARYLIEEFITEPSFAQRGVLGFVQPIGGKWDQTDIDFKLTVMRAQAKLYYKNLRDSSYVLALRVVSNKNLSEDFIKKNYCIADVDFLTKEKINNRELEFADYEAGNCASNNEKIVDWLPKALRSHFSATWPDVPKTVVSLSNSSDENVETTEVHEQLLSFHAPSRSSPSPSPALDAQKPPPTASATASPVLKLSQLDPVDEPIRAQQVASRDKESQQTSIKGSLQSSVKEAQQNEMTTKIASEALSTKSHEQIHSINGKQSIRRVVDLSWDKFQAGSTKSVYCLTINMRCEIFFVLADESLELRDYFIEFNKACNEKLIPAKNFDVGTDVVTQNDAGTRFCRGRIIKRSEDNKRFKLNLVDFGVVVKRSNGELFHLDEKWMQRQPAAYPGKLESVHIKTAADLKKRVIKQFVDVKVSAVNKSGATMILINQ